MIMKRYTRKRLRHQLQRELWKLRVEETEKASRYDSRPVFHEPEKPGYKP